jgi:hypothetical protein
VHLDIAFLFHSDPRRPCLATPQSSNNSGNINNTRSSKQQHTRSSKTNHNHCLMFLVADTSRSSLVAIGCFTYNGSPSLMKPSTKNSSTSCVDVSMRGAILELAMLEKENIEMWRNSGAHSGLLLSSDLMLGIEDLPTNISSC